MDAVGHRSHTGWAAPREWAASTPRRGDTSGWATPFQAVTHPEVFATQGLTTSVPFEIHLRTAGAGSRLIATDDDLACSGPQPQAWPPKRGFLSAAKA